MSSHHMSKILQLLWLVVLGFTTIKNYLLLLKLFFRKKEKKRDHVCFRFLNTDVYMTLML